MNKLWSSTKWAKFGSRPTPVLQRDFRSNVYLWAHTLTPVRISEVICILDKNSSEIFVPAGEDRLNEQRVQRDWVTGQAIRRLRYFQHLARQKIKAADPIDRTLILHRTVGVALVYSHYFERTLSRQHLTGTPNQRLQQAIRLNSSIRNTVQIIDSAYHQAITFLQKHHHVRNIERYTLTELLGEKHPRNIKHRHDRLVVLRSTPKQTHVYVGQPAITYLHRRNFSRTNLALTKTVLGLSVWPGCVRGKIKIIRSLADCKQLPRNAVAVSPMTLIQYEPYLKSIAALITDEGGITSHAAIVAREFKIPCIVGTKVSTKVFKNGDRVEVDATKGVVKKL